MPASTPTIPPVPAPPRQALVPTSPTPPAIAPRAPSRPPPPPPPPPAAAPPAQPLEPKKHLSKHPKPNELCAVEVSRHKPPVLLSSLACTLAVAVLLTVIVFGGIGQVFDIKANSILGINVDPDLQLALIGLINKVTDLLLTFCLENCALILLTLTMTRSIWPGFPDGVRIADLTVAKEMTNPWHAITAFVERSKVLGWRDAGWWSLLRFLLCATFSVCMLLQGLAINTLGIPKQRWYPDDAHPIRITHPLPQFVGQGVDYNNFWQQSWYMVRGSLPSWHVSDGLIASLTLLAMQTYRPLMLQSPQGWTQSGNQTDFYPALDTRYNGSHGRGLAVQSRVVTDIFAYLQQNGNKYANASVGWTGLLSLEFPSSYVSCGQYRELQGSGTVVASPIPNNETSRNWLELNMDPMNTSRILASDLTPLPFDGANCNITFERVRYPTSFWISNGASTASVSVNQYSTVYNTSATAVPLDFIDVRIAQALSVQVQATVARLETLITDMNAAQFFLQLARNLWKDRGDYHSDAEALVPIFTLLSAQLLSSADWNLTYSEAYTATSSPIRWQLFGSGPRLS